MKGQSSQFFWGFLRKRKALVCFYAILAAWIGLFGVFNAYLLKILIDRASLLEGFHNLILPLVLLLANSELHNISWRGVHFVCLKLIPPTKSEIIRNLFDCAHQKSYSFFQKTLSGSIAQDVAIVTDAFERMLGNIGIRLIRGGAQLIVSLILMGSIHFGYFLFFLFWMFCFIAVSIKYAKRVRAYSREIAKTQSEILGQMVDSFSAAKEVRLFGGAQDESQRLSRFLERWKRAYEQKGFFFLKFYLFQGFSITCLIFAMAYLLIKQHSIGIVTTGDFVYILSSTFLLTEMIWASSELIDQFNEQMGRCTQSLLRLLKEEKPDYSKNPKREIIEKGEIFFDSIVFSHTPNSPLFKGESLKISGGEKVGIVGKSGAGKSTLIHLLLGFYPLDSGKITIDGQDISSLCRKSLYQSIAVISQNPAVFQRSLFENIRFSHPKASKEKVLEAARIAGLDLQGVLDKNISDLSGGEKQRIAIARAVLKNAPIFLLDEPTSQLDAFTEHEVKASLYRFMKDKTTIAITHHLSTLCEMDRIIVLDRGKIVEEGTHCDLLKKNGKYADLWRVQFTF